MELQSLRGEKRRPNGVAGTDLGRVWPQIGRAIGHFAPHELPPFAGAPVNIYNDDFSGSRGRSPTKSERAFPTNADFFF
jgi:hypothetical protein